MCNHLKPSAVISLVHQIESTMLILFKLQGNHWAPTQFHRNHMGAPKGGRNGGWLPDGSGGEKEMGVSTRKGTDFLLGGAQEACKQGNLGDVVGQCLFHQDVGLEGFSAIICRPLVQGDSATPD